MKKLSEIFIAVILSVSMLLTSCGAVSTENANTLLALQNGDFENGIEGFVVENGSHTGVVVEVKADSTGARAGKVLDINTGTGYGSSIHNFRVYQAVKVEENTDYVWDFYINVIENHNHFIGVIAGDTVNAEGNTAIPASATVLDGAMTFKANTFADGAQQNAECKAADPNWLEFKAEGSGWVKVRISFNSRENTSVCLAYGARASGRRVLFDDWSIAKAPKIGAVLNGDFEDGANGFENHSTAVYEVIAEPDNTENHVLHIGGGGRFYQGVPVKPKTDYIWSFRLKKLDDEGAIYFDATDADGNYLVDSVEASGNTSWSGIYGGRASFDINSGNWGTFTVYFNSGENSFVKLQGDTWSSGRDMYTDDWVLKEAPKVGELINGDFENGTDGFTLEAGTFTGYEVTTVSNSTREGKVLSIKSGTDYGSSLHSFRFYQSVKVKRNTEYVWDFYVEPIADKNQYIGVVAGDTVNASKNTTLPITAVVLEGDLTMKPNTIAAGAQRDMSGNADPNWLSFGANWDWKKVKVTFNSGENDYICLAYGVRASGREVLFDDWQLYERDIVGDLSNGGFESGLDGIITSSNITASYVTDDGHDTFGALGLVGTSKGDFGQVAYSEIFVEENTDYIWSFWYKSRADESALAAVMNGDGSKLLPSYIKTFAPFDESTKSFNAVRENAAAQWHKSLNAKKWKKYSIVFNSGDNTTVRLAIDLVNDKRSGITDDWSLEKYTFTAFDADNNGRIDAKDLVSVKRQLLTEKADFFKSGADTDSDGRVDVLDLIRLKKKLVKLDAVAPMLNGVKVSDYAVIYSASAADYSRRAAEYICNEIFERTGIEVAIYEDDEESAFEHEIVVGETSRAISEKLDAQTTGVQFAILADDNSIALEGEQFVQAAAAYYFVETYISGGNMSASVPKKASVHNPIVEKAKNYIILIGDGMGPNQTLLFDKLTDKSDYSDGEKQFYGYYLPYSGFARTDSLSGTTDSAAGGTALATGHKTNNGYIGQDKDHNAIQSITELAAEKGMATAVMSTEATTGATPAAFSVHTSSRNNSAEILACQRQMANTYGTVIKGDFNSYNAAGVGKLEMNIVNTLNTLGKNENGFFMMYEEAYIDKHCHLNNMESAFLAVIRFNQAIARFMEYAFYNPDTFILITADHETGDLQPNADGGFSYNSGDHSNRDVPVFAYGSGAELFAGKTIENIQIPMTVASFMGVTDFGDQTTYKYLS